MAERKISTYSRSIHQGIAGIVASRLVDMFGVPSMVFGTKKNPTGEEVLVGSGRSVEGINIVKILDISSELLLKYGGHDMAAGATLVKENFTEFKNNFQSEISKEMSNRQVVMATKVVFPCSIEDVMNEDQLAFFELLEPFGPGNETPVFIDKSAKIVDARSVGRGAEHLQIAIRGKYANYKGIGFGLGTRKPEVQQNPLRQMRYTPTRNRFRGRTSWQIRVIDI